MTRSDDRQPSNASVIIRLFQTSDQLECQQMIKLFSKELLNQITFAFLSTLSCYVAIATVLVSAAALLWSLWIFVVFAVVFVVVVLYPYFKWRSTVKDWEFSMLKTDFTESNSRHMWVAEWNCRTVGMVRLDQIGPGVAELKNMFVVPRCRGMGISKKMLNELIRHAKRKNLQKIALFTTSIQTSAVQLYKKHGFKVVSKGGSFLVAIQPLQRVDLELDLDLVDVQLHL